MVGAQGHGRLMERRLRERNPPNGSFTVEAAAALRALAGGTDDPILLGYYPRFVTNPYQSLLYTAVREHGIAPVALPDIERLVELEALQGSGVTTLLHLHWLHLVLRDADSERDANRLADRFLGRLDRYLAGGGKLAWTVHNILPHDAEYEAVETRLNAAVAARSTLIHVLAAGTVSTSRRCTTCRPTGSCTCPIPATRGPTRITSRAWTPATSSVSCRTSWSWRSWA
jgi:hypothetical protein